MSPNDTPGKPGPESKNADGLRADVAEVKALRDAALDPARPEAVKKRRARGRRTVRENLDDFLDAGSFVEYGRLSKPVREDMSGPADGLVMGTGTVEGQPVAVLAYDYTVHAGTQSFINHRKTDRILEAAAKHRWPLVCWLEGGGARPHDIGHNASPRTFSAFAKLSGLVPTIGIVSGNCFAGNANMAGLCDILIATKDAVIGMAGPALVEAALGRAYTPAEIGPIEVHVRAGVIDILCEDDAEAVAHAQTCLSYFRGAQRAGRAPNTNALRDIVPTDPNVGYNVRRVIEALVDRASFQELRPSYGLAAVVGLARIEGMPVGLIANQPTYLAGSIDTPASDKMARFIQLCDAHDIPMLLLVDTPGLMAGPEVEKTGLVRHSARILTAIANADTPFITVVMRKAYGLGYYVMGSRALDPALLVAWPTAEFGGMGLEGAAAIIFKSELDDAPDAAVRKALHEEKTAWLKRMNTGLEVAGRFEFDDVIDPADTRDMVAKTLRALPEPLPRAGRKRTIDPW
ncbi:MAG: carboxyl transferase domain-containing protein [Alphaproteobacteria bacterium]